MWMETTYVDDKIHGLYKKWYENGQIEVETKYVDGRLYGLYKYWYKNGQSREETNYVDDIKMVNHGKKRIM